MNKARGDLVLSGAFATDVGARDDNQDYVALRFPSALEARNSGSLALVADGIGGFKGGRIASETIVRAIIDAYYSLSPTLSVARRAHRAIGSANQWIHAMGRLDPNLEMMGSTLSMAVFRGRHAHLFHIGDSRIYRLQEGYLECLTSDHASSKPGLEHFLYRAIGFEEHVHVEHRVEVLEAHDRYLFCSDGLHGVLPDAEIRELLQMRASPEWTAEELVRKALASGATDNTTVLVMDVLECAGLDRDELFLNFAGLPLTTPPKIGSIIDGFTLERVISSGRYSCLYEASSEQKNAPVVIKWPQPLAAMESEYLDAFVREAWIGAHVKSAFVAEIISLPPGRQTQLYSVMRFYGGITLEVWLSKYPSATLKRTVDIVIKIARGLYALHRQGVIHRDIKPENIMIMPDDSVKILDLGISRLSAWEEVKDSPLPGSPSYMAPELFRGNRGEVASDLFALGVTFYRLLTGGNFPFGEVEPFSTPRFGSFKAVSQCRPELPAWLDQVMAKSLSHEPQNRYRDAMELVFDLESGLLKGGGTTVNRRQPVYERDPVAFWRTLCLILMFILTICLYFLAHHPVPHP